MLRPVLRLTGLRTAVAVQIEPDTEEIRWAFQDPPDLILPCARFMGDAIRQAMGAKGEKLHVAAVPNAVDTERFFAGDRAEAKQKLGARVDVPLLLMLANLAPHKGQETAIRAVAQLKARGIPVQLWLAGIERNGRQEYGQFLTTLVANLEVAEQVRFLGFRQDGPELLRAADLLLLPSTHEGLPLSIVEAQASKVPVLAAPTAGIPEVISDGDSGFLIAADDWPGYANRIETLLGNHDLRQRIAERAFANVLRDYTMSAYCERVHNLLNGLRSAA
jgi:glycosyltransferase involved in cell wall biosynthesis